MERSEIDLSEYDAVLLDQEDLNEFIEEFGGPDEVLDKVDVFTEDDFTQGKVEFNMIGIADGEYGIVTQIHSPFDDGDKVLDGREGAGTSFGDWVMGLTK